MILFWILGRMLVPLSDREENVVYDIQVIYLYMVCFNFVILNFQKRLLGNDVNAAFYDIPSSSKEYEEVLSNF